MQKGKKIVAVLLSTNLIIGSLFCGELGNMFGEGYKALAKEDNRHELELEYVELTLGNTRKIELPQEIPSDAVVTYYSSNEGVAYVRNGVIVAESLGEIQITVTALKGSEVWEGIVDVTVRGTLYHLLSYQNHYYRLDNGRVMEKLDKQTTNIAVGKTAEIRPIVGRGTYHDVRYSVADSSVASIETEGIYCYVTGKKKGKTQITATYYLGNKKRKQVITVNVVKASIPIGNPKDGSKYASTSKWKGDYVYFGRYEQDNDYANGTEPILWRVLEVTGDSVLLLSEVCLEHRYYNDTYENATWKDSTLREWLNHDFMDNAFTGAEKSVIQKSVLTTSMDKEFGLGEELVTEDYVYLLSVEDVTNPKYGFAAKWDSIAASRKGITTEYAIANNGYRNADNSVCWWLRNNGISLKHWAYVFTDGSITKDFFKSKRNDGVRPALRIDLSEVSFAETEDGYFYIVP